MQMSVKCMLIHATGLLICAVAGLAHSQPPAHAQPPNKAEQKPLLDVQVLFDDIRIPKTAVATDGTILAFAKSCKYCRYSTDGGKTWSKSAELGSIGGNVIIDENNGDIMIVCPPQGFLLRSRDHGRSWEKEDIVIKPNAAGYGAPGNVPVGVGASESGITLQFGKHKGRLLMPARLQPPKGNNEQEYWAYNYNTAIYSDDGGKTWQTADPVQSGTGEGTLAELTDGRIYYNSRCHMAVDHRRRIAWSHDGGHRWTDWEVSKDLFEVGQPFYFKYGTKPSYGCNAGLVRMPNEATDGKDVLLFSTPGIPGGGRRIMTVYASFDGGETWPVKRVVFEGRSAYSSLTADKNGTIFLLYENGEHKLYQRISMARFNLEWLTGKKDWRSLLKD
jgi:sialidase-1